MDVISEATDGLEVKEPIISSIENRSSVDKKHLIHQKQEAAMDPTFRTPDKLKTPMDFSNITVEQLGITPESFVKNSPGKALLKKSRRRSTIGVRGSPETNLLIRYIAQQRNFRNANETPLAEASPSIQASPFRNRNGDSLRERISAFQSAFHPVKENEGKSGHSGPQGEFQAANCTKNKSPKRCDQPKLCGELPSKRRRISYQRDLKENIADGEKKLTDIQICHIATFPDTKRTYSCETSTTDHSKESSFDLSIVAQSGCLVLEDTPLNSLSGATRGKEVTGCAEEEIASNAASSHCGRRGNFEKELSTETFSETMPPIAPVYKGDLSSCESSFLRSVLKKTPVKLLLESLQEHCDTTGFEGKQPFSFSDLSKGCEELKNEKSNLKVQKTWPRKRVTFGEELSPEVFDESLPANTPLRKGGTPARQQDGRSIHPPFFPRLPISEAISQPSFEEPEQDLVNMEPLEVSFAVLGPASDSSSTETLEDTDAVNSNKCEKISLPKVDRITRSASKRKQLVDVTEEADISNLVNIDVKNDRERKPNRKKAQGTKNMNRTASKKIQVLKNCRRRKGKGKSLQKSFYGLREVASKKPLLSPIPEIPESPSTTMPISQRMPLLWCSDCLDLPKEDYDASKDGDEDARNSEPNKPVGKPGNKYLSENPETSDPSLVYEENDASEHSGSDIESDSSLGPVSFDQGSNVSTIAVYGGGPIQHADKLEHQDHAKKRTKNQNVCLLSPALTLPTEEEITPIVPKSSFFLLQPLQSPALIPNVESVCDSEGFDNTQQVEELRASCEEPKDASIASEERLKISHVADAPKAELNPLEDADMNEDLEQTLSHNQELQPRKPKANSGILTYRNLIKRRRRSSIYCPADQKIHFEEPENQLRPCQPMEELPFDNSELLNNLTESIKQAFRRLSTSETRVRRSTRFRRNSENQGLIWVSLPGPSTSFPSHKAKRRTVCSAGTREFENQAYTQGPCLLSSISGRENSENESMPGISHGARRKSFCASALSETRSASRPKYYRRTTLSHRNEENHPNDFEKMEVLENPNNI
ncbi:cell division cycle-associated protein 2 isoform X2 [Dromiciops gliroides]|uniref:cell division cycle-associated protein 2 isoform X2 n=1 Tax=Dromiciops gliroides TaxID=33562 RepID=UPI001CC7FDCF|nr:cell division cycle-associated protein 2 isoform X2 [Dromiciops gliroides]